MNEPRASKRPYSFTWLGETYEDPYHWLREREDPAVLAHLEAENAYTEAMMAPSKPQEAQLYQALRARVSEDDRSVPVEKDGFCYVSEVKAGLEYRIYSRYVSGHPETETVILDVNELAAGQAHCSVAGIRLSPDQRYCAYAVDFTGAEEYELRVREIETGQEQVFTRAATAGDVEWFADSKRLLYTVKKPGGLRPYAVYVGALGTKQEADQLVYTEEDERFFLSLGKSLDEAMLFIDSASLTTSEVWYLAADAATPSAQCFLPRVEGVEYTVEHHRTAGWFVRSNHGGAENFGVWQVPKGAETEPAAWRTVVAPAAETVVTDITVLEEYVCVYQQFEAVDTLLIHRLSDGEVREYQPPSPVSILYPTGNVTFATDVLRLTYESPVVPPTTIDLSLATLSATTRRVQPVPNYDATQYRTWREYATTSDGETIPLTCVARCDRPVAPGPVWLTAYGAYGVVNEPSFSPYRSVLLDKGFVSVIAHVRGGLERGKAWHNAGRLAQKQNTFTDFVAAAEHLVAAGYTTAAQIVAEGASAGGLTVGAAMQQAPAAFGGVIAGMPFVDVCNTMIDTTQDLTVHEYEEWGNPSDPAVWSRYRAYSPYDTVAPQAYPHLLVMAGLSDPLVAYWEPAKWVAKLRELRSNNNLLLLKTELNHGHGGPTGRYAHLRKVAFVYAFALRVAELGRAQTRQGV